MAGPCGQNATPGLAHAGVSIHSRRQRLVNLLRRVIHYRHVRQMSQIGTMGGALGLVPPKHLKLECVMPIRAP